MYYMDGIGCCLIRVSISANAREPFVFIIQLIGEKINPYHSNIVK